MTENLLLGIDIGTSSVKAAAVSADGAELGHGRAPLSWQLVPTGAEIDAGAFVEAAVSAAGLALSQVPGGQVAGVGVTSLAETAVFLGPDGTPHGRAIAWHDRRGENELASLSADLRDDAFRSATGLPVSSMPTIVKARWLIREVLGGRPPSRLLAVANWVLQQLGGEPATELSLASRTGMLDLATKQWWPDALAWAGLPAQALPPLVQAGAPLGTIRLSPGNRARSLLGDLTGRLEGAVLTAGGHDHLCAAVGAGVLGPGQVFDSCGTAEALVAALRPPVQRATVLQGLARGIATGWHVIPDTLALLASQRSGMALERILALLGVKSPEARSVLEAQALDVDPRACPMRVLDAAGELATVAGISRQPSPGELWRATAEAVADGSRQLLRALTAIGCGTEEVVAAGGWLTSPTLRAAKEARLAHLTYAPVTEAGARGAAILAGCAASLYPSVADVPQPAGHPMEFDPGLIS